MITPAALDLEFPTLLMNMPPPNVLAYPTETIVAETVEAMVDLGRSNSRMKDFTDLAMAARRAAFDGDALAAAIRATFRRRQTLLPDGEIVALTDQFTGDERALANWRAFAGRNRLRGFESLAQVAAELRPHARYVVRRDEAFLKKHRAYLAYDDGLAEGLVSGALSDSLRRGTGARREEIQSVC